MATASNRAALQTALLSVRGLRRRRLGHIGPADFPQNGLDKWGLAAARAGALGGGGGGRPAPRASLVLGGEKPISRRRNGLNGPAVAVGLTTNGGTNHVVGDASEEFRRLVSSSMTDQHQSSSSSVARGSQRFVNGYSSQTNGVSPRTNSDDSPVRPNDDAHSISTAIGSSSVAPSSDEEKKIDIINSNRNRHGKYSSDLIVVLDMDECLIHSQFLSDRLVDKYRQIEDRPPTTSSESKVEAESSLFLNACDSFRISLPDGDMVNVNKRPNLDIFLKEITSKFETYIFTAAMEVSLSQSDTKKTIMHLCRNDIKCHFVPNINNSQVYAAPVLNELDPHGDLFRGRFYREHCVYDPDLGVYAKNLCEVLRMRQMMIEDTADCYEGEGIPPNAGIHHGSSSSLPNSFACDERRVVLVDNNPLSFLPNPSNGILVSSFYDDPKDDTLEAVMELLHELDGSDDVRPILDDKFGLKDALEDVVKGGSIKW